MQGGCNEHDERIRGCMSREAICQRDDTWKIGRTGQESHPSSFGGVEV